MADVAVICPVLGRPQNAAPLADSLFATAPDAWLLFLCSPDDDEQHQACDAVSRDHDQARWAVMEWEPGPGDFARKINLGYLNTAQCGLVLLGADDLRFHPGWLEAVEAVAAEYDCGVIGTNDRANPAVKQGIHSTHPVVRRCYIDEHGGYVGGQGRVYFEGYSHQWTDTELVETAKARGCYAHAHDAIVEHLHPMYRRDIAMDDTYRLGQAGQREDRALYQARRHLWERERVTA